MAKLSSILTHTGGTKAPDVFGAQTAIPVHTLRCQDPLRNALMQAIRRDDAQQIQALVNRGAPLYQHYFHGPAGPPCNNPELQKLGMVNPVDWAVLEMRLRAAMQILELADGHVMLTEVRPRQAKMDEINVAAQTKVALNIAAQHGHMGLMRMLLERGCSVGQINIYGDTALLVATKAGKDEAVALLLQYGAWEVETRRQDVLLAAGYKNSLLQIFEVAGLLQAESDLKDHNIVQSRSPLLTSPRSAKQGLVSPRLTAPVSPNANTRREVWLKEGITNSVLQSSACRTGSSKPDRLTRTDWGWSPHGCLPLSTTSAEAGGAVAIPVQETLASRSGPGLRLRELTSEEVMLRGELTRAIRKGEIDKIHGLLDRGAPLDAAFDLGYGENGNCIDWACVNGHAQLALTLLSFADRKEQGDLLAQTAKAAFFWSVTQGYSSVLEELLRRGAPVTRQMPAMALDASGNQPHSALVAATFGSRKDEVRILLRHGAWSYESEKQREQLLEWSQYRKPIAEVFEESNIFSVSSEYVQPLEKSLGPEAARLNSCSPLTEISTRAPTGEPFSPQPFQTTTSDLGSVEQVDSPLRD